MREKLLLLASIAFLGSSATVGLSLAASVAEPSPAASPVPGESHAVAPVRRVLVELAKKKAMQETQFQTHYKQRAVTPAIKQSNYQTVQPSNYQTVQPSPLFPAIDKADIKIEQRLIADEVLRLMPKACQNTLQNFYVKYGNMNGRGLGGKSTIIVNGDVGSAEFRALFVHEFGHVIDLGCLRGSTFAETTPYNDGSDETYADDPSVRFYQISWLSAQSKKVGTTDADFVSGYASWDMFEDFAESFAYYVLQRDAFAARAQENSALAAKYAWFQQNLPTLPAIAIGKSSWNGTVPWDVTKLPYTWLGAENVAVQ